MTGRNVRLEYDAATGDNIVMADGWRRPVRVSAKALRNSDSGALCLSSVVAAEDARIARDRIFEDGRHERYNFKR